MFSFFCGMLVGVLVGGAVEYLRMMLTDPGEVVEEEPLPADPYVVLGDTGECYHRRGCRSLKGDSSLIFVPLSVAAQTGNRPCRICRPKGYGDGSQDL